jgi:hypothetical protein
MPVNYTYDEKENFVYTKASGVLTDEDLREFAKAMVADPRIKPGLRELVDLRAVDSVKLSTDSLGFIIHLNLENAEKYRGKMIALVATRELLYGLSKYFEVISHLDNAPFRLEVFRTISEAKEWLGLKEHHSIP